MEHREDEDNGGVVSNIDRPQDNLDLMQSPDDSLQLDEYRYDRTRGAGTSSSLLRAPSLETAGSTSSIPISGDDRVVSNIDRLQDNLDLMYARAEVGVITVSDAGAGLGFINSGHHFHENRMTDAWSDVRRSASRQYIAIAKSAESDSGKTSRLTALLRREQNHSLLGCFRGEGQWHGHGAEAHFEGAPNWTVVIAKLESFSELLRLSEHDCTPARTGADAGV